MNIQINSMGYDAAKAAQTIEINELTKAQLLSAGKQLGVSVGEILSGRIGEIKDGNILLILDNGQSLSAKLSGDMNIEVGQSLSFEVKSNIQNQTELRPLYTNLTATPTALAALSEASLPPTDRNVSMVMNMMEEGMAVSKQALLDMVSVLNSNPDVSPKTLVQMQKLGLDFDESTIRQFENYNNFEHKIVGDVVNLSEGLTDAFSELLLKGDEPSLNKLTQIIDMAVPSGVSDGNGQDFKAYFDRPEEIIKEFKELIESQNSNAEVDFDNSKVILNKADTLVKLYQNYGHTLPDYVKDSIKDLLNNSVFKDVLKDSLNRQMTLKPDEIREEGRVESLYKRLIDYAGKAIDILNNSQAGENGATKSAQNLMDNVQFMNQLNEMMTYVQLPLKLGRENAHGDLYVYTNKKKLAQGDGNFSALLHLDMEHLGPMDVHVAMQQEKVNTHFYMQDEATLDFIEANIHLLDERLAKKGYKMNTTVSITEKAKSMVDTFLEDKKSDGTVAGQISTLSFDVRA